MIQKETDKERHKLEIKTIRLEKNKKEIESQLTLATGELGTIKTEYTEFRINVKKQDGVLHQVKKNLELCNADLLEM